MKRNNKKIQYKDLVILTIILILTVVSLTIYSKEVLQSKKQGEEQNTTLEYKVKSEKKSEEIAVPTTDEELIKYLSTLGERDRMEYYCGEYFKHLERKEYDSAYNMLYAEFKNNYFPTYEKYEEYVKKTYPQTWALDYDDITRQGDIYVLRLKIYDLLGSKESEKTQRIVIKENAYNDFVISFQVI